MTAAAPKPATPLSLALIVLLVLATCGWALDRFFSGDDFLILHTLGHLGGMRHPLEYFTISFFEYYRPIAFLSHAADWEIWGPRPFGYHLTGLMLHTANSLLVFAMARSFLGPAAGLLAALLFAVHPSNHEAVFWMSARFDLLATFFLLIAFWLLTSVDPATIRPPAGGTDRETTAARPAIANGRYAFGCVAFALALLSKESALALPALVTAHDVFIARRHAATLIRRLLPLIAIMGAYALLRSQAADLEAVGGLGRLPKMAMLGGGVAFLVWLGHRDWGCIVPPWSSYRTHAMAALALLSAAALLASALDIAGAFVREKLMFVGFATFYLATPVVVPAPPPLFLDPATPVYWLGGLAAIVLIGAIGIALLGPLLRDGRALFLVAFIAAALIPVSSMTEGTRYLYLASIGVSALLAHAVIGIRPRWRPIGIVAVSTILIVSAWQMTVKARDWSWAGRMTQDAIMLVDSTIAPACGTGEIVFLTAPVGIRNVYTHFYRESFEWPRGCLPESYRAVLRVVRLDTAVRARWEDTATILLHVPEYQGNFVASPDLRHFTLPLRRVRAAVIETPLGQVQTWPDGSAQWVRIRLDRRRGAANRYLFYFSEGRVHRLAPPEQIEPAAGTRGWPAHP